jgi:hypothetical protein
LKQDELKQDALDHLADALMEDIVAASRDDLLAEVREDFGDTGVLAVAFDQVLAGTEALALQQSQEAAIGKLASALSEDIAATAPETLLREAAEDYGDRRALAVEFDSAVLGNAAPPPATKMASAGASIAGEEWRQALARPLPRCRQSKLRSKLLKAAFARLSETLAVPKRPRIALGALATALLVAILAPGFWFLEMSAKRYVLEPARIAAPGEQKQEEQARSAAREEQKEKFPLSSHADESRKKLNGLTQRADAPPPPLVPRTAGGGNGIEECDRLAASPLDRSLPNQVAGVELRNINVAVAEPACADAMARRPQVARFPFEAGRIAIARGDNVAAQRLFETAASLGNALAMYSLGLIYAQGQMANLDYSEARRWYQKAVEMNSPHAMAALAALYENGWGGPRDPAKALDLYRKAAAAGDSSSVTRIGYFYENGLAVSKDYGQALRWYRKGAELGDVDAMKHLGEMYGNGSGVAKSLAEARKWFERAKHASDAGRESIRSLPASSSSERPN